MSIREMWQNTAQTVDRGGMPAWLAVSVLGWIVFWPLGVFLTVNMLMRRSSYMYANGRHGEMVGCGFGRRDGSVRKTGNTAFDQYREETLKRLEDERQAFADYLERLRSARDQEEFDGWMKEMKSNAPKEA